MHSLPISHSHTNTDTHTLRSAQTIQYIPILYEFNISTVCIFRCECVRRVPGAVCVRMLTVLFCVCIGFLQAVCYVWLFRSTRNVYSIERNHSALHLHDVHFHNLYTVYCTVYTHAMHLSLLHNTTLRSLSSKCIAIIIITCMLFSPAEVTSRTGTWQATDRAILQGRKRERESRGWFVKYKTMENQPLTFTHKGEINAVSI